MRFSPLPRKWLLQTGEKKSMNDCIRNSTNMSSLTTKMQNEPINFQQEKGANFKIPRCEPSEVQSLYSGEWRPPQKRNQLCRNPKVNLFSRNTMVQNRHTGTMIVKAIRCPSKSEVITLVIPPSTHEYISYADLRVKYTRCDIDVYVYLEGASEEDKKLIMSSMIRDNEKLELNIKNGKVTVTPIKGNMIAMNGLIIKLKHAAKKIKSLGE